MKIGAGVWVGISIGVGTAFCATFGLLAYGVTFGACIGTVLAGFSWRRAT